MFKIISFSSITRIQYFLLLTFSLFIIQLNGQSKIDSLESVIGSNIPDTLKLSSYLELTKKTSSKGDSLLTIKYVNEGQALAKALGNDKTTLKLRFNKALMLSQRYHYNQAIEVMKNVLALADKKGYQEIVAEVSLELARNFSFVGNLEENEFYSKQAYKVSSEIALNEITFSSLKYLISVYGDKGQFDKALEITEDALQTEFILEDESKKYAIIQTVASIHMQRGNMDLAATYFKQSHEYYLNSGDDFDLSISHNNLAILYHTEKKYGLAIKEFEKALEISKKMNLEWLVAIYHNNLAEINISAGNYAKSLFYAREALKIYTKLKDNEVISSCLLVIGRNQSKQGNYDQAMISLNQGLKIVQQIKLKGKEALFFAIYR